MKLRFALSNLASAFTVIDFGGEGLKEIRTVALITTQFHHSRSDDKVD